MRRVAAAMAFATIIAGCSTIPGATLSPEQAVIAAAERPVAGVFVLTVRATGRQDFLLYLNSQADYRDQRNLSIEIPPAVELELADRFDTSVPEHLTGKRIRIEGVARRVRIDFTANDRPTGKYYYQTHVRLAEASQLVVVR